MKRTVLVGIMVGALMGMVGCSDSPTDTGGGNNNPPVEIKTCLDCHSSEVNLKASLDPAKVDVPLMLSGDG
jgi:hypothetical protein